jgi:putative hydrolase of the HAD superfamily
MGLRAVLWDFGGVITSSPFDAFAEYEAAQGLEPGFIRRLNATNPDTNAWARLERAEIGPAQFAELFEAEAEAAGGKVVAAELLARLSGRIRPEMVEAVRRCQARMKTALLTNNFVIEESTERGFEPVLELFDVIVESSRIGYRKPDPHFYAIACEQLAIEPGEAVFLDDLGVNLKPARAMGMRTIKVVDPRAALEELEGLLGFPVR